MKRETKGKLYTTLLKPVLTHILVYGSESWILTKGDEQNLGTFEGRVLRKYYAPTKGKEGWTIKYRYGL
jgi:hypothetical protein